MDLRENHNRTVRPVRSPLVTWLSCHSHRANHFDKGLGAARLPVFAFSESGENLATEQWPLEDHMTSTASQFTARHKSLKLALVEDMPQLALAGLTLEPLFGALRISATV